MNTDQGTVLPPLTWAITWSEGEGWQLLMPAERAMKPGSNVPAEAIALTGAFVRLTEEQEFRDECEHYFKSASKS